jgi:hypothetical protein
MIFAYGFVEVRRYGGYTGTALNIGFELILFHNSDD